MSDSKWKWFAINGDCKGHRFTHKPEWCATHQHWLCAEGEIDLVQYEYYLKGGETFADSLREIAKPQHFYRPREIVTTWVPEYLPANWFGQPFITSIELKEQVKELQQKLDCEIAQHNKNMRKLNNAWATVSERNRVISDLRDKNKVLTGQLDECNDGMLTTKIRHLATVIAELRSENELLKMKLNASEAKLRAAKSTLQ